jgi:hypothetical protein
MEKSNRIFAICYLAFSLVMSCAGASSEPQTPPASDTPPSASASVPQPVSAPSAEPEPANTDTNQQEAAAKDAAPPKTESQDTKPDELFAGCTESGSKVFQFANSKMPEFECGAKNLKWPQKSTWSYFRNLNLCSRGERVYRIDWHMNTTSPVTVGAAISVRADKQLWEPLLGMSNCGEGFCGRYYRPIHGRFLRDWQPQLWEIPSRKGVYWMIMCVPDKNLVRLSSGMKVEAPVERLFRFRSVSKTPMHTETYDCCVHFNSTLP